jgi:hypothetical protein
MGDQDKFIHVTSTSPVEIITRRPLRFPAPRLQLATDKHGFEFWWAQLQAVSTSLIPPRSQPSRGPDR